MGGGGAFAPVQEESADGAAQKGLAGFSRSSGFTPVCGRRTAVVAVAVLLAAVPQFSLEPPADTRSAPPEVLWLSVRQ